MELYDTKRESRVMKTFTLIEFLTPFLSMRSEEMIQRKKIALDPKGRGSTVSHTAVPEWPK